MTKLFISYRREDSLDVTGRIFDRLAGHFGHDSVFMDVDTIPYGVDFRHYLSAWISACDVVLVVIGKNWLEICHQSGASAGQRRLDDPADFVRIEVATALSREIPVVPVLVGGATEPPPGRLPTELADLAYRQKAVVGSGQDFHGHMDRLIGGLERILKSPPKPPPPPPPRPQAVRVDPPAVAYPTNLGFDEPDVQGMPFGWFNSFGYVSGVSTAYEVKVLPREGGSDGRCVRLRRSGAHPEEFGSLMQRCPAKNYVGKVVRFEGELRTENLDSWAGLWLRIDGKTTQLFFDNMHDRPLLGSTPWSKYSIATLVPQGSEWLNYGILLVGNGRLWADNFSLAVREAVHEKK